MLKKNIDSLFKYPTFSPDSSSQSANSLPNLHLISEIDKKVDKVISSTEKSSKVWASIYKAIQNDIRKRQQFKKCILVRLKSAYFDKYS